MKNIYNTDIILLFSFFLECINKIGRQWNLVGF